MKTSLINFKNGAKLLFNRQSDVHGIAIKFVFMAGSINDPQGKLGVAHFCEHALCNFSNARWARKDNESYARKFQYRNAYTSMREMCFVLHTVDEDFEDAIDFLTESFHSIKFKDEEFNEEKRIIEDEIKMEMQINNRLMPNIINTKVIDEEHFNNNNASPAGTLKSFSKITLEDLKQFIKKYITSNNLTISICGNIKKSRAVKIVKKYVEERLPSSKTQGLAIREVDYFEPKCIYEKAIEQGKTIIFLRYVLKKLPFSFDETIEDCTIPILSSVLNELTFNFFRLKYNLCYGCQNYIAHSKGNLINDVIIYCQEENLDEVMAKFGEFIQTFNGDLLKELFEKHKKSCVDRFNFDLIGITKMVGQAENIYYQEHKLLNDKYMNKKLTARKKVSYENANDLYKMLFKQKPFIIVIASDKYKNFGYSKIAYKQKN